MFILLFYLPSLRFSCYFTLFCFFLFSFLLPRSVLFSSLLDNGSSYDILIGCVIGGFFGILLVFGLSYTMLQRSETLQKCFSKNTASVHWRKMWCIDHKSISNVWCLCVFRGETNRRWYDHNSNKGLNEDRKQRKTCGLMLLCKTCPELGSIYLPANREQQQKCTVSIFKSFDQSKWSESWIEPKSGDDSVWNVWGWMQSDPIYLHFLVLPSIIEPCTHYSQSNSV